MTIHASTPGHQASRRRFLQGSLLGGAAALAGPALLSACGSGDIASALQPARLIVLGDGLSDLGDPRYTVNDGSVNIWALQVASRYSLAVSDVGAGGTGYAEGLARVLGASPSVEAQVTAFLASGAPGADDVFLINAPMQDVIDSAASAPAADAAGKALAAQVRRLIDAGARHVLVAGLYDLGKSPLAIALNQVAAYSAASLSFNSAFKIAASDLGTSLLFVDAAYYINLLVESPTSYGLTNATTPVCTSTLVTDCTTATLLAGVDYNDYLFADDRHFTPEAHRLLGNYAYDKLVGRW